jgi:hypothetical protein
VIKEANGHSSFGHFGAAEAVAPDVHKPVESRASGAVCGGTGGSCGPLKSLKPALFMGLSRFISRVRFSYSQWDSDSNDKGAAL